MSEYQNQVIEAGAGTGKTYSLVNAILQALFQRGIPFPSLVALTFTKKAAGEMKERVALELHRIIEATAVPESYRAWGHTLEELQSMAKSALEQIDRANISTIHSFAFSLLKRFPLLAGINPESEVDEKGLRYDDFFDLEWPRWLSQQLRLDSPHEKEWLEILSHLTLSDIEEAARRLCDFDAPLWALPITDEDLPARLTPPHKAIQEMVAAHPGKEKACRVAVACEEVLGIGAAAAWEKLEDLDPETISLLRADTNTTKPWPRADLRKLEALQKIAENVAKRGDRVIALLTERLRPFVARFRSRVLSEGYLSNSALLSLACELVRRDHTVRSLLKREYRAIFVDEFQDTDPLQGELLLFLSEKMEGHAARWGEVQLEAGKLFVVGDPKQSIYRFRGADIAAYRQVADMIIAQGGIERPLQRSWRSQDQIIHVVNQAFSQIIQEKAQISPAYVPLIPGRARDGKSLQDIEVRLTRSAEKQKSKDAAEREAYAVAHWISEHVGQSATLHKTEGSRPLAYKDIALIFRSTPAMRPFVEALREYGMPFVIEGERYFYSTPEVTDLINFLRVIENPHDTVALVGFLRSPLGGFTDPEILALRADRRLDPTHALPDSAPEHQRRIWELLGRLQSRVGREPLKMLLRELFQESFILELAARSYHHDQTVANLLKLKRLLETFAEEGVTTLRALLAKVRSFMENDRLEGESPLADDSFDAIRILTIHKAKGLEFPVVILPALHQSRSERGHRKNIPTLTYEWSSGRLGLRVAGYQNLEHLLLDSENEERQFEEEKRVLYVAMTRAREHLLLSGAINLVRPASESYLGWLSAALGLIWAEAPAGRTAVAQTDLDLQFIEEKIAPQLMTPAASARRALEALNAPAFAAAWAERAQKEQTLLEQKLIVHPTEFKIDDRSRAESSEKSSRPEQAILLGTLVHRFLERWDFACKKCDLPAFLREVAKGYFAGLGIADTPTHSDHVNDAQKLLADFIGSPAFEEIQKGEILGREVPFFYKTAEGTLMRGIMDILYRTAAGELVVGDYKSGSPKDADHFKAQSDAYLDAIQRALGEKAQFKLIFLRTGNFMRSMNDAAGANVP